MSKELDAALEADSDELPKALLIKLFEAEKATKPVPEGEEESVFLEAKFGSDRWQLEWKLAKLYFAHHPDENKLDKSAYRGALTHYFIKDPSSKEIYAVKPGEALGAGTSGKTKVCYNERGEEFAVKVIGIRKGEEKTESERVKKEAAILKEISRTPVELAHVKYDEGVTPLFSPKTRKKTRSKKVVEGGDDYEISEKMFIVQKKLTTKFGDKLNEIAYSEKLSEDEKQKQILGLFLQAAEKLAEMHKKGYIHMDFKPANLMLDENGEVFLIDLDATLKLKDNQEILYDNAHLTLRYSEEYAPPEITSRPRGLLTLTPKTDIFCFGRSLERAFSLFTIDMKVIAEFARLKFSKNEALYQFYKHEKQHVDNILSYVCVKYNLTQTDFEKILTSFIATPREKTPPDDALLNELKEHIAQHLITKRIENPDIQDKNVSEELEIRARVLKKIPLWQLISEIEAENPEDRPTLEEVQKRIQEVIDSKAISDEELERLIKEEMSADRKKKRITELSRTRKQRETGGFSAFDLKKIIDILNGFPKHILRIEDGNRVYEENLVLHKSQAIQRIERIASLVGKKQHPSENYIEVKKALAAFDFSNLSGNQRKMINLVKRQHPEIHRLLKIKIEEDILLNLFEWLSNGSSGGNQKIYNFIYNKLTKLRTSGEPISLEQTVSSAVAVFIQYQDENQKESDILGMKEGLKTEFLKTLSKLSPYYEEYEFKNFTEKMGAFFDAGFEKGIIFRREDSADNPIPDTNLPPENPKIRQIAAKVDDNEDDELTVSEDATEDEPDYLREEDEESVLAKSKEGSEPVYEMEVDVEESEFESDLEEDQLEEHETGNEDIESDLREIGEELIPEVSQKVRLHRESHDKKSRTGERTFSLDKFNPFEKRKKLSELIESLSEKDFLHLGVPLPEKGTGQYPENFTSDYIDTYKAFKQALNDTDFSNLNVLEKLEIFMLRRNPHLREFLDRKISEDKLLKRATFIAGKYPDSTAAGKILAELNQLRKDGETVNLKLAAVNVYMKDKSLKADIIKLCSKKIGKDVEKAIDEAKRKEREEREASRRSLLPHGQSQKKQPKNRFLPPSLRPSKKG